MIDCYIIACAFFFSPFSSFFSSISCKFRIKIPRLDLPQSPEKTTSTPEKTVRYWNAQAPEHHFTDWKQQQEEKKIQMTKMETKETKETKETNNPFLGEVLRDISVMEPNRQSRRPEPPNLTNPLFELTLKVLVVWNRVFKDIRIPDITDDDAAPFFVETDAFANIE
ncbi:hypothetical protein EYR41_005951 [Orbilia oligospora]|uniref:Uncharacterized protein n=1 Tax=Orbilia oligospora TaxID=2813651 RepID=A0A7C8TZI1_ORBOL|nr:hypothetical protein TWF751_004215 [Orbilia oligospora]TGJ69948.1 hypothetical protein EYR41_005951 [Orbilia oligospora]